ncbi:MAG: hypothetical protein ISS24_00185 [Candidatus Omnitrophica bacterium]|nr:hypothetical protein [Candidatus Omnitrophota bacterium]
MQKNKKLAILIILVIVAVFIWLPKGKRKQQVSPKPVPISLEKVIPRITPVQRKRTGFADWGRNPFIWYREGSDTVAGLTLSGIIWDNEASYAIINGAIVHSGDKIAGKTVRRIESDKVILSDGLRNYVLELE